MGEKYWTGSVIEIKEQRIGEWRIEYRYVIQKGINIFIKIILNQLYLKLKFHHKLIISQLIKIKQELKRIMGNEHCKQCKQNILQSQAYGTHQILQQDNTNFAVVQKLVQSSQETQKLKKTVIAQLQVRKDIRNIHIVSLCKYAIRDQKFGFKVVMNYEYIPKTLKDRIEELRQRNQQFTQRQIFSIIYAVQSALTQLSKNNIKHCCINMETILCKNNIYKITDVSSTAYITSYQLVIKGNRQQFLSEKLLGCIYNKSLNPNYQLKDDLFSLGMVVLAVASQKDADHFYHWNNKGQGSINFKNLEASLKAIQKKYSSKLVKKIKSIIYNSENEISQNQTNLTQNLLSLDEQYNRIMTKVTKFTSEKNKSAHQTIAGTPERNTLKSQSFPVTQRHQ